MLKAECLELRSAYESGRTYAHLGECADCRAFAAFVDGLGELGMQAPLADGLRNRLRDLPEQHERRSYAFPRLPMLPLPAALERRLKQIARAAGARKELPIWIRSPRFAIAASYLLTLLFAGTVGNPAAWGQTAADQLDRVGIVIESAQVGGRKTWQGIEERAHEGFALSREFYRTSKSSLRASWLEFVDSITDTETTDESDVTDDEVDPS